MRMKAILLFILVASLQLLAQPSARLVVQIGQSKLASIAFFPDGQVLTAGDHTAILWDVSTGFEIRAFFGHTDDVISAAFSPSRKKS